MVHHLVVKLSAPHIRQPFRVSRLVAIAFVDNPNNYHFVRFRDGDRYNVHYSNLYWSNVNRNIKKPKLDSKKGKRTIDGLELKRVRGAWMRSEERVFFINNKHLTK